MNIAKFVAKQLGNPSGLFSAYTAHTWNRRNAALNDTTFDFLALQPYDRVLEVGFGGGYLIKRLLSVVTEGFVAGVDHSEALVGYAQKRYQKTIHADRLDLKCAAAEALPYPDYHFTKACSVNSIFYWQDIHQGLREIKRVLIVQGKLVLCFTHKGSLENKRFAQSLHLFDDEAMEQALIHSGFQNITAAAFTDPHRQYICMTAEKPTEA